MTKAQRATMDAYIATGRVAVMYPRKKMISVSGRLFSIKDAVAKMAEVVSHTA